MKNKILISGMALIMTVAPIAAFAQNASTTGHGPGGGLRTRNASDTAMQKLKDRADKEIDNRIASLNKLLARIQEMKNLSDSQKASISSTVSGEVASLNGLKTQIDSEASTTALRDEVKTITAGHRIYALIMPQINVIAAADRATTVVSELNTVGTKLQSRIAADSVAASNAAVETSMSDLAAKLADAQAQVQAAVNEVTVLTADNGDKTKFQANLTAFKDARSKIKLAQQDLVTARKDARAVLKVLMDDLKNVMGNGHGGGTATSTGTTTSH